MPMFAEMAVEAAVAAALMRNMASSLESADAPPGGMETASMLAVATVGLRRAARDAGRAADALEDLGRRIAGREGRRNTEEGDPEWTKTRWEGSSTTCGRSSPPSTTDAGTKKADAIGAADAAAARCAATGDATPA